MAIYVDDYGCIDTEYIVHTAPADACGHGGGETVYAILMILHVGSQGYPCSLVYPQRHLRDMALERILALIQRDLVEVDFDDDEDD